MVTFVFVLTACFSLSQTKLVSVLWWANTHSEEKIPNRTSLGSSRTDAKDTTLTALWWKRCLRNQLFLTLRRHPVFFSCFCLHEYSVLRVWTHLKPHGSVGVDCLPLLFLPWHWTHQPTKSLSNQNPTYLYITIQHSTCWENLISPRFSTALLFADGGKSSAPGQLQSRPAALSGRCAAKRWELSVISCDEHISSYQLPLPG